MDAILKAKRFIATRIATAPPPPAPPPAPVGLMRTASVGGNFSEIGQGGHISWLVNLVQEGVNGWKDGVNRQLIPGAPEWPTSDFIVTPKNVVTGAGGAVAYGRFVGFADSIANGDSNVYHGVSNVVYDAVSNVTTFNVDFPANLTSLNAYWNLLFLGTRRTGGASGTINTGVTELQIATPGYTIADIASKIITDEAKIYAQSYKCLRFMDSSWTIGNLTADFLPNLRATQHLGYTWDDLIDICNKSGCDMWWNVPAAYTDAAVTALFQYIDAKLDPALHCYWEYVNETWNSGQIDAHWQFGEVLTEAKGFAGSYHDKKGTSLQRVQRAGNVLTFTTDHADLPAFGYVVGGGVYISMPGFDVATRTPVVAVNGSTFAVADTGADGIVLSVVMPGHNVRSITRAAGVCTLTENVDLLATWGWVVGTVIQLYNFDGLGDIRLFAKPNTLKNRRMGVALAIGGSIDDAVNLAEQAAAKVSIHYLA